MSNSATIEYFGREIVENAVANYFVTHGMNDKVRKELMLMAVDSQDDFFQMVCDFVEKNG